MSLEGRIFKVIKANGAMRLDQYIATCLYDKSEGYYATRTVFGAEGDFVTSPEISQIFGEITALWLIDAWQKQGAPKDFALVELGAGRGIWLRDILRAAKIAPQFLAGLELFVVENSERRREEQQKNIPMPLTQLDRVALPAKPCFVISNEFFDALPIRQFRAEAGGWLEAFVGEKSGQIARDWRPVSQPPFELSRFSAEEKIIEINQGAINTMQAIGAHLREYGGAVLTVDYGAWDGAGETLQAMKNHQFVSPFLHQGEADITAHIRFRDLADAAGLNANFMTQGEFLQSSGGDARLAQLVAARPDQKDTLTQGYQRLTSDDQMGRLFKVLIQWGALL